MDLKPGEVANGSLGMNDKKTPGSKQPDYTGKITTDNGVFRLSVWALVNPDGTPFFSFSLMAPKDNPANGTPKKTKELAGAFDMLFKAVSK